MTIMSRTLAVAVLAAALGAPYPVLAGEPTEQLRRHVDAVVEVVSSPELAKEGKAAERRAAIRKVAERIFDFEETARRALGRHWQSRTPAERAEFVRLFTDLLEHAYVSKIEQYRGERIVYAGDAVDGDQATVRTRIHTPKGADVPLDYRMRRVDGRWRVYDAVIEGVSLVSNYRTQFNKIIQTSSYEDLVQKLRARSIGAPETPRERRG